MRACLTLDREIAPDDHQGRDDVLLHDERLMVGGACDTLHSVSLMATYFYQ
jgi:hypothetical protein